MSAYSTAVLADSPVLYARLGEASGSIADSSTNAATGTVAGTFTYGASSLIAQDAANTALTFAGTANVSIKFPNITAYNAAVTGGGLMSLECWFKTSTGNGTFISMGDHCGTIRLDASGHIQFVNSQVAVIGTTATTYIDGSAHHVVVTKNGTTSKFYVDNVDVTPTITNSNFTSSAPIVVIGADASSGTAVSPWLTGTIDEVAVYTIALSSTQIANHYTAATQAASSSSNLALAGPPGRFLHLKGLK